MAKQTAALSAMVLVFAALAALEYSQAQSLRSRPASTSTATETVEVASGSSLTAFLIFHQEGVPCAFIHSPWAVTVQNQTWNETEVEPPSGLHEIESMMPGEDAGTNYNASLATITFLLTDGVYNYTMIPAGVGGSLASGAVTIDGADVAIQFPSDLCPA